MFTPLTSGFSSISIQSVMIFIMHSSMLKIQITVPQFHSLSHSRIWPSYWCSQCMAANRTHINIKVVCSSGKARPFQAAGHEGGDGLGHSQTHWGAAEHIHASGNSQQGCDVRLVVSMLPNISNLDGSSTIASFEHYDKDKDKPSCSATIKRTDLSVPQLLLIVHNWGQVTSNFVAWPCLVIVQIKCVQPTLILTGQQVDTSTKNNVKTNNWLRIDHKAAACCHVS